MCAKGCKAAGWGGVQACKRVKERVESVLEAAGGGQKRVKGGWKGKGGAWERGERAKERAKGGEWGSGAVGRCVGLWAGCWGGKGVQGIRWGWQGWGW